MQQRTEEWKDWRKHGVTATDVAPILGKSPYRSIYDIFEEKMGKEGEDNFHMKRGRENEESAIRAAESHLGKKFEPRCMSHPIHEWARASLDGITENGKFLIEVKCPFKSPGIESAMDIPEDHFWQIKWQLFVSRAVIAYYVVYVNDRIEKIIELFPFPFEGEIFKGVFEKCKWFYENCVVEHQPPFPFSDKKMNTLLENAEKRLVEIKREKDELEKEEKLLKDEIIEMAAGAEIKTPHLTLSYKKTSTLDKTALKEDGIDLSSYYKESGPFAVLRIKKGE